MHINMKHMCPLPSILLSRFFMRINPEEGTKCTAKTGVSWKTGAVVKRKAEAINSSVV